MSQGVLSEEVYILFSIRNNQKPMNSNLNGNGHLQLQKTFIITKSPKMKSNAECSKENVPTEFELKTHKSPFGLKTNVDVLNYQEKRPISTSTNGGMLNTEKLFSLSLRKKYFNTFFLFQICFQF